MTSRRVLVQNPHKFMPTYLIRVVDRLLCYHSLTVVKDREILRMAREMEAMLPSKMAISDREVCRMVKEAIGWRASYRAERWYKPNNDGPHTPDRQVARTEYCLPRRLFPKGRYVQEAPEDPFRAPERWLDAFGVGSKRINELAASWWGRMWQIAFGGSTKAILRIEAYVSMSPYIHYEYGSYGANHLHRPMAAELVRSIAVDKGFLYRLRVVGLQASDGFLPVDVIADDNGSPSIVIAFRRTGDTIVLEGLPIRPT